MFLSSIHIHYSWWIDALYKLIPFHIPHFSSGCPENWIYMNENCYNIMEAHESINWLSAEEHCQGQNAHLASITSHNEMLFIHSMLVSMIDVYSAITAFIGKHTTGIHSKFYTFNWKIFTLDFAYLVFEIWSPYESVWNNVSMWSIPSFFTLHTKGY